MPAGFWENFEKDFRVEKQSEQGPWGGTRTYYWKSRAKDYFNEKRILDFASSNGWSFVGSVKYYKEDLGNTYDGKPIIEIEIGPFEYLRDSSYSESREFQRWTHTDLTLYKFKTGWLIFDPGTDSPTEINGFVTLSVDGREMTVYHLWGE